MKALRAKQILVTGLVALVLVAGYYRWTEENKAYDISDASIPVSDSAEELNQEELAEDYREFEDENVIYANAEAKPKNGNTEQGSDMDFSAARRERDSARGQALDILRETVDNENSTDNAKQEAQKKISDSASNSQSEGIIEGLVKAKGYEDCITYIENGEVRVIVKAEKLEADGVSQIKDIVVSQTGIQPKNIKISSK